MHEFKEQIAYCLDYLTKLDQLLGDGCISESSVDDSGNFVHDRAELDHANVTAIGMCVSVESTLYGIRERLLELDRGE